MIYLDSAATTLQKPRSVAAAAGRAVYSMASPGRGGHSSSMKAADALYGCRITAAKLFNVPDPSSVVITFNATHALNIAIKNYAHAGVRAVISGYEHNAVVRPLYASDADICVVRTPLFDDDALIAGFQSGLEKGADLAVCTHVSNVFGYVLPVYEISKLCKSYGVPLIIDASQSAGVLNIDFNALNVVAIAMPGHKSLFGVQGSGLLLCSHKLSPLIEGGTGTGSIQRTMPEELPERLEAGTYCVPGIAGLTEGMKFVLSYTPARILAKERHLIKLMAEGLEDIPELMVYKATQDEKQSGVLSFRHARADCEDIAARLALQGIAVRAGLHCAPFAHETAGTLETGTVRVSVSVFNTEQEIRAFLRILRCILGQM